MTKQRNKLYFFLSIACIFGYIWILSNKQNLNTPINLPSCLFKKITTIPCPSCGSTRAVIELTNGNFLNSILLNPLGIVISFLMITIPIWILKDLITQSNSFFKAYHKIEFHFKKPVNYISFIILILMNWFWNMNKFI